MKKAINKVGRLAVVFLRDVIVFFLVGFLASPTFALGPRVIGWGLNYSGQITPPPEVSDAIGVSAGGYHSLALKRNGTVVGWGNNGTDQITIPEGLTNVEAIASGAFHNLALKKDGTVVAWGFNGFGQTTVPPGLSNVIAVAAGAYHSLALKADGTVVGWGYDAFGEATPPPGLNNVVAIAAGFYHSMALKADGTVVCWGENAFGQCSVPNGLNDVIAIAAGGYHSLALKSDGTIVGWGYNGFGQTIAPPTATNVIAIAAGAFHSLALRADYKVISWGRNDVGQGDTPLSVLATNAAGIAAGFYHSLALIDTPPTITTVNTLTGALEDQPFTINFNDLANAADENDVDGDPVVFSIESVLSGTLKLNGNPVTTGTLFNPGDSLVWTPVTNANGIIQAFTIRAFDGVAYSTNYVNVSIDVTPVNDVPVADDQSVTTDEDTAVNITLTGSDVDGDTLTFIVVTQPAHGTLSGTAPNLTYTPAANYHGSDSFTFKVNDGTVDSAVATVSITVNSVNDAPVVQSATFNISENSANGTVVGTVTATDVENNDITFSIISGNTGGAFAINPTTGEITVANSAALNYEVNPTFTLTVQATDNGTPPASGTGTVTINLVNVNEAPVVPNQTFSVPENSPNGTLVGTVSATDEDAGQTLTYSIISGNTNGTFMINSANGKITIANNALVDHELVNTWTLTVKVQDNGSPSLSTTATITINITDVNESPVISPQSFTVPENSANGTVVGTVVATDPDIGQTLTFEITSGNTNNAFDINPTTGQITVNNSSVLNYEATPVWTLSVKVTDNGTPNLFASTTITINISNVNEPPVINPQTFSVTENSPAGTIVGTVVASDPDAGTSLIYSIVSGNTNNTFSIGAGTGQITVANNALLNYEATPVWTIKVRVTDNGSPQLYSEANITINLNDANDAPIIAPNQTFSVPENSASGTVVGTVIASDEDAGQTLTYAIIGGNTNSAFAINPSTGQITVNNGSVLDHETVPVWTITVQVTDNGTPVKSSSGSVVINISNVNEPPTAVADTYTTPEDVQLSVAAPGVLGNDIDVDNSPLTAILVSTTTHGSLTLNPDGSFVYMPNTNYYGIDQFTYKASDGEFESAPVTVTITITSVNDPPIANPQTVSTPEDTPVTITLTGSDPVEGTPVTFEIVSNPMNGTLSGTPPTVTYTPSTNFNGTDTFTFRTYDGTNYSDAATVTINVTPVNDAPIANPQSVTTDRMVPVNITLTGSDIDGDSLTFNIATQPAHGTLSGTPPNVVYTPQGFYYGTDSFTFTVSDGQLVSAPATVSITINYVNLPPSVTNDTYTTLEDTMLIIPAATGVLANDYEPDSEPMTVTLVQNVTNGTLSLASDGSFLYMPNPDYYGTDTFKYVASDGTHTSTVATVTITIVSVNDAPPTISAISPSLLISQEDVMTAPATFTIGDSETPVSNLVLTAFAADPTLVPSSNVFFSGTGATRQVTILNATNRFGSTRVYIVVTDDGNPPYSATNYVDVTFTAVNDPPSFNLSTNYVLAEEDQASTNIYGFAYNISPGPYETGQSVTFVISNSNPSLFHYQPAIDSSGTLSFKPYPDRYGTAVVTVYAQDNGGGTNNKSAPQTFTIEVKEYNDPPTISAIGNQVITEDSVLAPVPFTIFDPDTPLANLTLSVTSTNTSLVPVSNIVIGGSGANRTISATPLPDANGITRITITVSDNDPFFPKTASITFVLTVQAVNDPPSFTMGPNITAPKTPVTRYYANWATNISPGPANESFQSVTFVLTADNPSLFSVLPAVTTSGTLTFKPVGIPGTANITIYAQDNGGSGYGGIPFSTTNVFTITLTP